MSKQFKPSNILNASNSTVTGLRVDRHGNIVQIRAAFNFKPRADVKILSSNSHLNPIELAWENQRATL